MCSVAGKCGDTAHLVLLWVQQTCHLSGLKLRALVHTLSVYGNVYRDVTLHESITKEGVAQPTGALCTWVPKMLYYTHAV
jgi:hypothetical protein